MIVLDESIQGYDLIDQISDWYSGTVVSVRKLRPATLIKDDGIATLLHAANHPTLVTINVKDFWLQFRADKRFCIVCLLLEQHQALAISPMLRSVFVLPQFRTKAARMETIIRIRPTVLEYYGTDRQIHRLPWPP